MPELSLHFYEASGMLTFFSVSVSKYMGTWIGSVLAGDFSGEVHLGNCASRNDLTAVDANSVGSCRHFSKGTVLYTDILQYSYTQLFLASLPTRKQQTLERLSMGQYTQEARNPQIGCICTCEFSPM